MAPVSLLSLSPLSTLLDRLPFIYRNHARILSDHHTGEKKQSGRTRAGINRQISCLLPSSAPPGKPSPPLPSAPAHSDNLQLRIGSSGDPITMTSYLR